MKHSILFDPSYSMLEVQLEPGETLQAESGAMVSRSTNTNMDTSMNAGREPGFVQTLKAIAVALIKKLLGGESFFVNEFSSSDNNPTTVTIAPKLPGSIVCRELNNQSITLQGGAFLACTNQLEVKVKFAGLKAIFSGHGLFFLEISGTGQVFFSAYGGVLEREVSGSLTVDTGHLVGFDPGVDYIIRGAGGLKSTLFSGEGLVMDFSGKGKVYLQSRNVGSLVSFINPRLPL